MLQERTPFDPTEYNVYSKEDILSSDLEESYSRVVLPQRHALADNTFERHDEAGVWLKMFCLHEPNVLITTFFGNRPIWSFKIAHGYLSGSHNYKCCDN